MSNIFKPNIRQALNQNTSGFFQGIFGGDSNVFKNLEENMKMSTLLKSVMLQTKKPGKAGKKSGAKGAKKAAAGGSKGKKNPREKNQTKQEPRRTPMTPRARRIPRRKVRSPMIHVS